MNSLKKIALFYVFANLHVALATAAMTYVTLLKYEEIDLVPVGFVFLSTVVSYNFIRLVRLDTIKSWMAVWLQRNRKLMLLLSGICTVLLIVLLFQLRWEAILSLSPFFLLTFFYSVPVFYTKKTLRFTPGIKLFVIAFSWAGVTVFFPLVDSGYSINMEVGMLFIQRIFLAMALTIPFDIRDLNYDKASLKTIPQLIGVKNAKLLGAAFALVFMGFEFYFYQFQLHLMFPEFMVGGMLIMSLYFSNRNQNKWLASFWVEGIPIIWLLLLLI
ncbi:MAG: hypothetical protein COB98_08805 [Flavobacteriaceae bacterium]|nr:MAG: hypothetical protein COB98_08805 [Flavobacteriaceae bacterium]